jgi:hypothetical protein
MAIETMTNRRAPRSQPKQSAWATSLGGDILALLVGLGACYMVRIVGDIPVSEVILIPLIAILLAVRSERFRLRKRKLGLILTLMLLWLLGQIVTDVYRSTVMDDWIRGDADIAFFFLDLIGMVILLKGNIRRQMVFYFGLAIGVGLTPKLEPGLNESAESAFKFAYAFTLIYLVTLASCYFYKRRKYLVVGLLFMADIGVNVLFNCRSVTLVMFITTCLILPVIPERIGRFKLLPPMQTKSRILAIVVLVLVAGVLAAKVMTTLADSGVLGQAAQSKNQQETMAGWGLLLGGRPEILVSSRAVYDSPILGHGSWAKDPKYSEMLADIEAEYGMHPSDEGAKFKGLIPAHSHLMGAWVFSGVCGAIFWAYILVLSFKSVIRAVTSQLSVTPVYTVLMVLLIWDILFSPFGGIRRITVSFFIVIICDLLDPDPSARKTVLSVQTRWKVPLRSRNLGRLPVRG